MDYLHEQIMNISKAQAYDIIREKANELEAENKLLKERVKYLEDLIKEYTDKAIAILKG